MQNPTDTEIPDSHGPQPPSPQVLRVMVAGPMRLVRHAIQQVLASREDVIAIGEASGSAQAVRKVRTLGPDVLIFDASESPDDAFKCLAAVRRLAPRTRVLLLTSDPTGEVLFRAAAMGVSGVLGSDVTADELLRALRRVASGQAVVSTEIIPDCLADIGTVPRPNGAGDRWSRTVLSPQEKTIVRAMADGSTDWQIAASLAISVSTVKAHVRSILKKTGAPNRTGAVATAFRARVLL